MIADLKVRWTTEGDLPEILKGNPSATRDDIRDKRQFSLEEAITWFRRTGPLWWCVVVGEAIVGYVRVRAKDGDPLTACIGCDIFPQYRRNGYASSARVLNGKDAIASAIVGEVIGYFRDDKQA